MAITQTWDGLSEHQVLDAVEQTIGSKLSNICIKRNSYINRVFELEAADGQQAYIAKFYRPGRWRITRGGIALAGLPEVLFNLVKLSR